MTAITTTQIANHKESIKSTILKDANALNHGDWDEFVYKHPDGNAFQTSQMYTVFDKTDGFEPILIVVLINEKIKGLLLAVIQQETKRNLGFIARRAVIRGGPLIDGDDKILKIILREFDKIIKSKVLYTQIRNWADTSSFKSAYLKCGYNYIDHLNILLDLNQAEEEIWGKIKNSKKRSIRKAIRDGVKVNFEMMEGDLRSSYSILLQVYDRIKLPCPDIDFFENCQKHFKNGPKFITLSAIWEDKTIAFRYVLAYKNVLYVFYAGGLREYYSKNGNDLLNWELILWGKANGYSVYDFAGAGSPNADYGVRVNKLRFGGKLLNLGRYQKIHHPVLFYFVKMAFYLRQKFPFRR